MSAKMLKKVRPDAKGRILLGALTKGISSFSVTRNSEGQLILDPNIEIPAKEKWLWQNKIALQKVKKGLQDSAASKVKTRGSFTKFTKENE